MTTVTMSFPEAWAFVNETHMDEHTPTCSYRQSQGAILCDCHVLWDEYDRRAKLADGPAEGLQC